MERTKADMTDTVFAAVLTQLGKWFHGTVCPFLNGELFMDKKIESRLHAITTLLPSTRVGIHTNGSMLNENRLSMMQKCRMAYFNLSLQATSAAEHKERTGLRNWDHILAMIRLAVARGLVPTLLFNDDLNQDAARKLASSLGARHHTNYTYTWRGIVGRAKINPADNTCNWVNNHIFILSNGDVVPCCMDLEGELRMGNVMTDDLKEMYQSEGMEFLRASSRGAVPFCSVCNMPPRRDR
jgi:radical SAM protein with 4Fe4S-binding SPASM domain